MGRNESLHVRSLRNNVHSIYIAKASCEVNMLSVRQDRYCLTWQLDCGLNEISELDIRIVSHDINYIIHVFIETLDCFFSQEDVIGFHLRHIIFSDLTHLSWVFVAH
jgi:hypothetical protein